jgi:hypothetical protein
MSGAERVESIMALPDTHLTLLSAPAPGERSCYPQRFPQQIGFVLVLYSRCGIGVCYSMCVHAMDTRADIIGFVLVWGFCVGAQGADQPNTAVPGPGVRDNGISSTGLVD